MSPRPVTLTRAQEVILTELIAEGFNARVSATGWLLVSGRRTDWREGYWMAFLGWRKGWRPPRIVRSYFAEGPPS